VKLSPHQRLLLEQAIRVEDGASILNGVYIPWKSAIPMLREGAIVQVPTVHGAPTNWFRPTPEGRAYVRRHNQRSATIHLRPLGNGR